MMSPFSRAVLATTYFTLAGVLGVLFVAPHNMYVLPHALFYAVITLNTFFSVRLYASIQPAAAAQYALDALLTGIYTALALSIGRPEWFAAAALAIFIAATPKYAHMLGRIPHDALLRRKILIDLSGVAFCALVFAGTAFGYPYESAWVLAVVFALANVYHLLIHPMYRL